MKTKYLPRLFTKKNTPSFFKNTEQEETSNENNQNLIGMIGGEQSNDLYYRIATNNSTTDLVKHRYKKNNIDVVIAGTYNDVTSILHVLNKTVPVKITKDFSYFNDKSSEVSTVSTNFEYIPVDDKHIHVKIDNKTYSGSGVLLIVKNKNNNKNYFALFKSTLTHKYDDLGGKIDRKFIDNEKVLSENSIKEALEESIELCDIKTETDKYVDIHSNINDTYYRVYLYKLEDTSNNINKLMEKYNDNMVLSRTKLLSDDYHETNDMQLFDTELFKYKLDKIYYDDIPKGTFLNYKRDPVNVNGRVIKVIKTLFNTTGLYDSIMKKDIDTSTITNSIII